MDLPQSAPVPSAVFYYALSFIFGTLLLTIIGWIVSRYIASTDASLGELKKSNSYMLQMVERHNFKHETHEKAIAKQEQLDEKHERVIQSMLQTLSAMQKNLEILNGKHERTHR
jgi:hypothetical protein